MVDSKLLTNNTVVAQHLKFVLGAEAVNFKPVFIATSDTETFTALADGSFFVDETGAGRKVSGVRTYFRSELEIQQMIVEAIAASQADFFFDPTTQLAPSNPNGPIQAGDRWVVSANGTWDGVELKKGDLLTAPNAITGSPEFEDLIFNAAITGLQSVADATTAFAGLVKIIEAIRLDGTATHATVATEKAVADAILEVQGTLNAAIQNVQDTLSGQIDAMNSLLSSLDARIETTEDEIDDAQARLVVLEEWTLQGTEVLVGNGSDANISVSVTTLEFKNVEDVTFKCKVSDGQGGYRNEAIFPVGLVVENGVQKLKASFASAPPTGMFKVRIVGLAKTAA